MKNELPKIPKGWHEIHDFLYGFGVRYYDGEDPFGTDKVIYAHQVERFLGIKILTRMDLASLDFDVIYDQLQPLIEAHREKVRKEREANPRNYKTISVPKVNRAYPHL